MWAGIKNWLLAFVVSAAVIGGCASTPLAPLAVAPTANLEVYGAHIYFATAAPMSETAMRQAFEAAAQYWGTAPTALTGWVVIQRGNDPWDLGGSWAWGVSYMDIQRLDFATMRPDCPQIVLVHEWAHAGAGIMHHDDERFEDPAIYAFLVNKGICQT